MPVKVTTQQPTSSDGTVQFILDIQDRDDLSSSSASIFVKTAVRDDETVGAAKLAARKRLKEVLLYAAQHLPD